MSGSVPLTPFDDYPFHQGLEPLIVPSTSDSHYQDGYYFAFYRPGRHMFCGLRLHPNSNVMDGYAGLVDGAEQRNVRMSRALLPNHSTLSVGPLTIEVLEPMARQRLKLDENPTGVTFDITITHSMPPFLETPQAQYRYGRLLNRVSRYTLPVRANGTMSVNGKAEAVDDMHGCRDHSWGIRSTMGPHVPIGGHKTDVATRDRRAMRLWIPFEVDGLAGFVHTHEDEAGHTIDVEGRLFEEGHSTDVVSLSHDLRHEAGTQRLKEGTVTLATADDRTVGLSFEVACPPAHPQGFGYARGWCDGGQPGVFRGIDVSEHDGFGVDDPSHALGPDHVPKERRLGGTEFASTVWLADGRSGMAHVEYMRYV